MTHRCPRCEALVNEMCLLEELKSWRLRMVQEASPEKFLEALRPGVPGMRGRMLLDEAMACVVDWSQCAASMCCLGCALDLRCCQARSHLYRAHLRGNKSCAFCSPSPRMRTVSSGTVRRALI